MQVEPREMLGCVGLLGGCTVTSGFLCLNVPGWYGTRNFQEQRGFRGEQDLEFRGVLRVELGIWGFLIFGFRILCIFGWWETSGSGEFFGVDSLVVVDIGRWSLGGEFLFSGFRGFAGF